MRQYASALVDLLHGSEQDALERLRVASGLPDAAFLAGVIVLRLEKQPEEAEKLLSYAVRSAAIGDLRPSGVFEIPLNLVIANGDSVPLPWDSAGAEVALGVAEYRLGKGEQALARIRKVLDMDPRYENLRIVYESL